MVGLATALNRAAWCESERGMALRGGLVLPPTVVALPDNNQPKPTSNSYTTRMAELYRTDEKAAWSELIDEMLIPADQSHIGQPLLDSRLWDPAQPGTNLGEYCSLPRLLGRPVANPVRRIESADFMEARHVASVIRRSLPRPLMGGATEDDLLTAVQKPSFPLFLSRVAKIKVFRMPASSPDAKSVTLKNHGHRLILSLRPPHDRRERDPGIVDCQPVTADHAV